MTVRPPFFVFVGLLVFTGLAAYFTPGETVFVYYRILYLLGLIMVVGLIGSKYSLFGLEINRSTRFARQQVGQIFEERFEIRNNSWLSRLWVEINDLSGMPGKHGSRVISHLGAKQHRIYFNRTYLIRRGAFVMGPTALVSGDVFGMFTIKKVVQTDKPSFIVLPYMVHLTHFPAPTGILPGGRALRRRSLEVTPYAAGVREYVPGDPLNRIHWKSTARKDRLIVKEFEQDPQADVWILLDAHEGLHLELPDNRMIERRDQFWALPSRLEIPLPPSTFEYAVSSAASIAQYFIAQGQSLGFASASKILTILPAERGERQLAKILERLAFVQPDGQLPILGLIESQANHIARGSTVVLITTASGDPVELGVDILMRRDLRPVLVFIDPQSFGASHSITETAERIKGYGIHTKTIRKDDSLQLVLEG